MKIKTGHTRIVILWRNMAIKIAKPRFLRYILRIVFFPLASKRNKENYYETYGHPLRSWKTYIFFGLQANTIEYTYSKNYHRIDPDIVPVPYTYLGGWVIIQKMGKEVTLPIFKTRNPFRKIRRKLHKETTGRCQYVFWNNRVCLADYGALGTVRDLIETIHIRANLSG